MISIRNALLASVAALALSSLAMAQSSEFIEGEVRKVDKESRKVTLKHGPMKELDMPGMTMAFQVKEDAMLDKVQTGDKVRFQVEKIGSKLTVTTLEVAR